MSRRACECRAALVLGALGGPLAPASLGGQSTGCVYPEVGDTVRVETKVTRTDRDGLFPHSFEGRVLQEARDSIFVDAGGGVEAALLSWHETRVSALCRVTNAPAWDGLKKGVLWGAPIGAAAAWLGHEHGNLDNDSEGEPVSLERNLLRGAIYGGVAFGLFGALTGRLLGPDRWIVVTADDRGPGLIIRAVPTGEWPGH